MMMTAISTTTGANKNIRVTTMLSPRGNTPTAKGTLNYVGNESVSWQLIPHLREDRFDVRDPKRLLAPAEIFVQSDELTDSDLVSLDLIPFSEEGVHVADEGARNLGR
jgi:hypothetical protein